MKFNRILLLHWIMDDNYLDFITKLMEKKEKKRRDIGGDVWH